MPRSARPCGSDRFLTATTYGPAGTARLGPSSPPCTPMRRPGRPRLPPASRPSSASGRCDTLFDPAGASLLLDDEQDEAPPRRPPDRGRRGCRLRKEPRPRGARRADTRDGAAVRCTAGPSDGVQQVDGRPARGADRGADAGIEAPVPGLDEPQVRGLDRARWLGRWGADLSDAAQPRPLTASCPRPATPSKAPRWDSVVVQRRALAEAKFGRQRVAQFDRCPTPDVLDEELERVHLRSRRSHLGPVRQYHPADPARADQAPPGRKARGRVDRAHGPPATGILRPPPNQRLRGTSRARREERPLALADGWTHVFIDECQDFTESDFRLLACIPPDPKHLFVTGDESQSMHLGACCRRSGLNGDKWKKHELGASYRLPSMVCEALEGLALAFIDAHAGPSADELDLVLPESRKAAVILARSSSLATSRRWFLTFATSCPRTVRSSTLRQATRLARRVRPDH
jgi:hypothetical protein